MESDDFGQDCVDGASWDDCNIGCRSWPVEELQLIRERNDDYQEEWTGDQIRFEGSRSQDSNASKCLGHNETRHKLRMKLILLVIAIQGTVLAPS